MLRKGMVLSKNIKIKKVTSKKVPPRISELGGSRQVEAQNMEVDAGMLFTRQLSTLRKMLFAQAAAQGLAGVVNIWWNILSCVGPGCKWKREEIPNKHAVKSFMVVLAWKVGGKAFPQATSRILELLFTGLWQGLPVGLKRGTHHPFEEPIRRGDEVGQRAWNERMRETAMAARARRYACLSKACVEFLIWCKREHFFFFNRVICYDSTWPSSHRTASCFDVTDNERGVMRHEAANVALEAQSLMPEEMLFGDPLSNSGAFGAIEMEVPASDITADIPCPELAEAGPTMFF